MRIAGFLENSVVDGPGQRFVIKIQGCPHNCLGCYNPDSQDLCFGHEASIEEILNKLDSSPNVNRVTISGGEPFAQALECARLVIEIKHRHPESIVWLYSGYTYEEILQNSNYLWTLLLDVVDVLVDGKYDYTQKTKDHRFIKSSNQRIIDVRLSKQAGKVVLYRMR